MNQKMLFWILICLLMNVTQQYDDFNKTFCYKDTNPNYCVLCGCYKTEETQHTLSCGENEVIRMEPEGHPMKTRHYQVQDPVSCVVTINGSCKTGFDDTGLEITLEDRVAVYKLCTLQNTCNITIKPVVSGNVKLVRYPYVCENNIISMSNATSLQVTDPVLYFTGKDHVGDNINCGCTVTTSDQQTMRLEIFYINGDNMCNGVTFNSFHIFQCTNNTQLYTRKIPILNHYLQFDIRNITATGDDVLYFKVHGNVRVTCSGCLQNTVSTSSSSTKPTNIFRNTAIYKNADQDRPNITITNNSRNIVISEKTNQDRPNITIANNSRNIVISAKTNQDRSRITTTSMSSNAVISENSNQDRSSTMTTSMSSNEDQSTTQSNKQSDMTGFGVISEHDEKLKAYRTMFGGIIAAILIATLLGIGIYCCIRRRNTTDKLSNGPNQPVSTNTPYAHADYDNVGFHSDTESSHYQELNLYLTVTG